MVCTTGQMFFFFFSFSLCYVHYNVVTANNKKNVYKPEYRVNIVLWERGRKLFYEREGENYFMRERGGESCTLLRSERWWQSVGVLSLESKFISLCVGVLSSESKFISLCVGVLSSESKFISLCVGVLSSESKFISLCVGVLSSESKFISLCVSVLSSESKFISLCVSVQSLESKFISLWVFCLWRASSLLELPT